MIDPVIITPLRRKWAEVQERIAPELGKVVAEKDRKKRDVLSTPIRMAVDEMRKYLGQQRVLDPACGSGNFLYVALQQLLDLDDEIVRFVKRYDIDVNPLPYIRPTQLHGIEINPYAAELAQVVVWIGYLQWIAEHSISNDKRPILDKLVTIENRDAILDLTKANLPVPAVWPEANFIVGNPPFLGSKMFRGSGLSDEYLQALWEVFDLPRSSDLCCYWFELARRRLESQAGTRTGLLATQGIRGGDNRAVLGRIKKEGDIFMAWSDRNWALDGAMVHVSIIGFARSAEERILDGVAVDEIHADLTSGVDATAAQRLSENKIVDWSIGTQKGGDFDLEFLDARALLAAPTVSSSEITTVLKPWISGIDVVGRDRGKWVIYFPPDMPLESASTFDGAFQHALGRVKPFRDKVRRDAYRKRWWIHQEAREGLDEKLHSRPRFLLTATLSKFRIFAWASAPAMPDKQTLIFLRDDDYFFGVVHSCIHELWARVQGTQLREEESGFRYTPTSCFETFPLPWPPSKEAVQHLAYRRIAEAAKALNGQRERWLNPPEWIDLLAAKIDAADTFEDVPKEARSLVRQSAIMAAAAKDARLKKRTLTNLYNERPTWLKLAHERLDRAVLAAYAAVDPDGEWSEDWAEVWVTGARQLLKPDHALAAKRAEVDQRVLANLLRLNHARAKSVIGNVAVGETAVIKSRKNAWKKKG